MAGKKWLEPGERMREERHGNRDGRQIYGTLSWIANTVSWLWATVKLALESMQENPWFRSLIPDKDQNILNLGTGDGRWAIDVADMLPSRTF